MCSYGMAAGFGTPLGGGIGLLSRACGLGADNILEAHLVLADGSLVCTAPQFDSIVYLSPFPTCVHGLG